MHHRGPPPLAVASVSIALFVAALAFVAIATGGRHFPSPFGPAEEASAFFAAHGSAVRVGAFLQFGSAVPFVIFAATVASRLRFLGVEVAGPTIALVGGVTASAMTMLSALAQWILAQP